MTGAAAGEDRRTWLRRLPSLRGPLPRWDVTDLPEDPTDLFLDWLRHAVEAGVREPHAVTVATVSPEGRPSARVVVLKDVAAGTWSFATDLRSQKARDLAARPATSLSWYWPELGRQVRVEGTARLAGPAECAADFLARSPASRAAALAVRPGEPLGDAGELEAAMAQARRRVEDEPGLVLPEWVVVHVDALVVEAWQGSEDRAHTRVRYVRDTRDPHGPRDPAGASPWRHDLIWP